MATRHDDRELGLHRRIPRRDFLNGMAIGITGAYAAAALPTLEAARASHAAGSQPPAAAPADYPPALTGLRGNYPASVEAFGPMRAGG
jgi:spermidine dehydrogenase